MFSVSYYFISGRARLNGLASTYINRQTHWIILRNWRSCVRRVCEETSETRTVLMYNWNVNTYLWGCSYNFEKIFALSPRKRSWIRHWHPACADDNDMVYVRHRYRLYKYARYNGVLDESKFKNKYSRS